MWWSVVLAVIGVFGLYLTTRKMAAGYAVGVGVQVLWITYAVVTAQYGFIFSALAFGAVNALGFYKWKTEGNEVETIVMRSTPIAMPPDSERTTKFAYSALPPHAFNHKGEPKWDIYPFIEVWGDRAIVGSYDKRFTLKPGEAYRAGRALLEAADFIFNKPIKEQKK